MGEITLTEALEEYKNIYMAYRNFAERTREEYQNDLESFIEFLEKSGVTIVKHLKLPAIERFVAELEMRGYASLTRKRKVVTIRSFLMFLYQDGYIDTNIAKKIILPFAGSTNPKVLTRTECDRLRKACAGNSRDRAIVELLIQTGIKLSELTRLNLSDCDFEKEDENKSRVIRVRGGRGRKDRLIPMNSQVLFPLKNYLRIRRESDKEAVFLNRFGKPLGERGVQKLLKKYFKRSGIIGCGVHTLRHTYGIHQIASGTDKKAIQKLMGHSDPRTISMYASMIQSMLTNMMAK